jgi:hypothetical protein
MPHRTLFLLLLTSILLSACRPGQVFGPTTTLTPSATLTPSPTATLTPAPTSTPTLKPTPIVYDGEWAGTTSAGGRVTFRMEGNNLVAIRVNFGLSTKNSNCNVDMNTTISPGLSLSVNTFSLQTTDLTIKGAFDSATTASGTVIASHDSPHCSGGVDLTWTAERK